MEDWLAQGPPSESPEPELRNARWDTRGGRGTPVGLLRTAQGYPFPCTPPSRLHAEHHTHPSTDSGLHSGLLACVLDTQRRWLQPYSLSAGSPAPSTLPQRECWISAPGFHSPNSDSVPKMGRSVLLKHSHFPKLGTLNSNGFQPPSTRDSWRPHPSASSDAAVQALNLPTSQTQVSDPQPPARPRCPNSQTLNTPPQTRVSRASARSSIRPSSSGPRAPSVRSRTCKRVLGSSPFSPEPESWPSPRLSRDSV